MSFSRRGGPGPCDAAPIYVMSLFVAVMNVSPPAVLTGETVTVTMTARVSCEPMPRPVHVALVLVIYSDHGPDAVGEALQIARISPPQRGHVSGSTS